MTFRRPLLLLLALAPLGVAVSAADGWAGSDEQGGFVLLTVVDAPDASSPEAGSEAAPAPGSSGEPGRPDAGLGPSAGSSAGSQNDAGAGAPDAAAPAVSPASDPAADAGSADACAALADRLERRRAWMKARREEQFALGGPPDPARGVPNAFGVWCGQQPAHEECSLGSVALDATTEELAWGSEKTPEDFDPHVILMRRAVKACRTQASRRW